MHHVVLERWSRGQSYFHRRDPRAKTAALLVFLVLLATSRTAFPILACGYLALLALVLWRARVPVKEALARAAVVLPFSGVFALISVLAGEPARGGLMLGKSYLSALAVLIVIATTPLPQLLRGVERLGAPRFLLLVIQFLYRYLFVISEEAQHMRIAARSRGGASAGGRPGARFRAAAGAVAVLFARSYARAQEIHRAMLARGFSGRLRLVSPLCFGWADAFFLCAAVSVPAALRLALEVRS